jgi:hypothetical protein
MQSVRKKQLQRMLNANPSSAVKPKRNRTNFESDQELVPANQMDVSLITPKRVEYYSVCQISNILVVKVTKRNLIIRIIDLLRLRHNFHTFCRMREKVFLSA